jgi:hypothetical protein
MIQELTMTFHDRQNSIAIVTKWHELHANAKSVMILCITGMTCPLGTLLPLKLMDTSLHLMLPLLSRKPATVGSLLSTLLNGDLNHMCRAFNEHTGVYVRCQAHQLRFLPQEHMSGTYDVCASYMYLYS